MTTSNPNKKHLRLIGHNLKPVVTVAGKGLTENVLTELNRALDDHELIKVKLAIDDRIVRKELARKVCTQLNAELIQEIGKVVLLFKVSDNSDLRTSNIHQSP